MVLRQAPLEKNQGQKEEGFGFGILALPEFDLSLFQRFIGIFELASNRTARS
jgi:hypothetical protein